MHSVNNEEDDSDDVIFIREIPTCSSTLNQEPKNVDIYVNETGEEEIDELQRLMDQAANECLSAKEPVENTPLTSPFVINPSSNRREQIRINLQECEESAYILKTLSEPVNRTKLLSYLCANETDLYLDSTVVEDGVESKISSCQFCDYRTFRDVMPHVIKHLIRRSCDACGQTFETPIALIVHRRFWCERKHNQRISAAKVSEGTETSGHSEIHASIELDKGNSTCVSTEEPELIVIDSDSEQEMVEDPPGLLPPPFPPLAREPPVRKIKINVKPRLYQSIYSNGELMNPCDFCPYSSSYSVKMKRHIKKMHRICYKCKRAFKTYSGLSIHLPKCNSVKMERHITKLHPTCHNCERIFKTYSGLSIHLPKCKISDDHVSTGPKKRKSKVMRKNKKVLDKKNDVIKTSCRETDDDTVDLLEEESITNGTSTIEDELSEAERAIAFLVAEEKDLGKQTNWEEGEEKERDPDECQVLDNGQCGAMSGKGRALIIDEVTRLDNRELHCASLAEAGQTTLSELDFAPLTKWLVRFHCDNHRLLVIPARKIQVRVLSNLFSRHTAG